jgi:hypothetical protein
MTPADSRGIGYGSRLCWPSPDKKRAITLSDPTPFPGRGPAFPNVGGFGNPYGPTVHRGDRGPPCTSGTLSVDVVDEGLEAERCHCRVLREIWNYQYKYSKKRQRLAQEYWGSHWSEVRGSIPVKRMNRFFMARF